MYFRFSENVGFWKTIFLALIGLKRKEIRFFCVVFLVLLPILFYLFMLFYRCTFIYWKERLIIRTLSEISVHLIKIKVRNFNFISKKCFRFRFPLISDHFNDNNERKIVFHIDTKNDRKHDTTKPNECSENVRNVRHRPRHRPNEHSEKHDTTKPNECSENVGFFRHYNDTTKPNECSETPTTTPRNRTNVPTFWNRIFHIFTIYRYKGFFMLF